MVEGKESGRTQATGRRKEATASVWVTKGTGEITVNGRSFDEYFVAPAQQDLALQSLAAVGARKEFDVIVQASGGGLHGQAGAVRHAIARALCEINADYRPPLKKAGLMTRDPRARERKKSGQPGARRRFQFSKR